MTDPRTGTTVTHYNEKGQVDWTEDPAGNRTRFEYDPNTGRKTAEFNALNKSTRYAHNNRGQLTRTWGDVPYPVEYVYDNYGRMTEMRTYRGDASWNAETWPEGQTPDITRWHHQPSTGLLLAKEDAAGKMTRYTHDTGGRLRTRTWARLVEGASLVTTYVNNPVNGELTDIDYSDATPDIHFDYDRLGRQSTITDAVGTRMFAYNPTTLQLESESILGIVNQTITRTYETETVRGRNTGFTLGKNYAVTYGYDPATGRFGQIAWNVNGQSDTATYAYVANSELLAGMTAANGQMVTTYAYEERRDLKTAVENAFNATVISRYGYEYDEIARRKSVTNTGTAFGQPAFNHYAYNDRNEVTGSNRYLGTDVNNVSIPVDPEKRLYNYDPIGNRNTTTEGNETSTYTSNNLNQYTDISIGGNTENSNFDDDGNLTMCDGKIYTYNGENRLISVQPAIPTESDTKVEFVYDYMGRRARKQVFTYGTGQWNFKSSTTFVYDGWNVVLETTNDGSLTKEKAYVWGLDLSQSVQGAGGVGGLIALIDGASVYFYCYDGNGNVGQLVSGSGGMIVSAYEYDPFGNAHKVEGTYAEKNCYRFSTKYFDAATMFFYYGYRYYDAKLGRWLNRDPVEEIGSSKLQSIAGPKTEDLNAYGFVRNCPILHMDSLGLVTCKVKSFSMKVKGWIRNWPESEWIIFDSTKYTLRLNVKFSLELDDCCSKEDCLIGQKKKGRSIFDGKLQNEWNYWAPDGAYYNGIWWDGEWWGGQAEGRWGTVFGRNKATFVDQPGFYRVDKSHFPIFYGGAGGVGFFQFKTMVLDKETRDIVRELNWGMIINYSSPNNGYHYYYL